MYANEIMSVDVKSCTRDANLEEISRLMWDCDCGAVPVVNQKGKPIGIVTDRDIAMAAMLNHKPLWEMAAAALIEGQRLCTCEQEETVESCLHKMEQYGVRRLPVVDAGGRLCGIITMGDVLAFAAKPAASRSKTQNKQVPVSNLMAMLKNVSGHHAQASQSVEMAS